MQTENLIEPEYREEPILHECPICGQDEDEEKMTFDKSERLWFCDTCISDGFDCCNYCGHYFVNKEVTYNEHDECVCLGCNQKEIDKAYKENIFEEVFKCLK